MLEDRTKEVADGFVNLWSQIAQASDLVSFEVSPHMVTEPIYPCNPRDTCPKASIRVFTSDDTRGNTIGCKDLLSAPVYRISVFFYRLQVSGENHQCKLLEMIKPFKDAILKEGFCPTLNVPGLPNDTNNITTAQTVVFDQLEHEYNDPDLVVSAGELNLTLSAMNHAV